MVFILIGLFRRQTEEGIIANYILAILMEPKNFLGANRRKKPRSFENHQKNSCFNNNVKLILMKKMRTIARGNFFGLPAR